MAEISDHQLVACWLSLRRDNKTRVTYTYRNIKSIDVNVFCNCVRVSHLYDDDVLSLFTADKCAVLINSETLRILNNIALLKTRTQRQPRNDCRWQTEAMGTAKRNCRQVKRRYLCTRSEQDRHAYRAARRQANTATSDAQAFFQKQIEEASGPRQQ